MLFLLYQVTNQYTPVIGYTCVLDCAPNALNLQKTACVITCLKGEVFDPSSNACLSICPQSKYLSYDGMTCISDCSAEGKIKIIKRKKLIYIFVIFLRKSP